MSTFSEYFDGLPDAERALLQQMLAAVKRQVPDAVEGVSYGMPALLYKGKGIYSTMSAKRHLSLYPFSGKVLESLRQRLAGYELSAGSGSVHFSLEQPLSDDLLAEIVAARVAEVDSAASRSRKRSG